MANGIREGRQPREDSVCEHSRSSIKTEAFQVLSYHWNSRPRRDLATGTVGIPNLQVAGKKMPRLVYSSTLNGAQPFTLCHVDHSAPSPPWRGSNDLLPELKESLDKSLPFLPKVPLSGIQLKNLESA